MELKKIDPSLGFFQANGKTYKIEKSLSIERYSFYQRFEIELGYGSSFQDLYGAMSNAYNLLNQGKMADASVALYNAMRGFAELEKKEPHVLKYCALFINTDDEDRRVITDDMISAKIKDWQEEGLEVASFFQLALNSIPGFIEAYRSSSQATLEPQGQEKGAQ